MGKRKGYSSSSDDERREKKKRKRSSSHKEKDKRHSSRDEADDSKKSKSFGKISDSDYFLKNTEFQVWVYAHEGKTFDQLSSHESRKLFSKFVKKWNKKKLPEKFYQGINETEIDSTHRTKHKWNFTMDRSERDKLASAKDSVDSETHHRNFTQTFGAHHPLSSSSHASSSASATSANAIEVAARPKIEKGEESDEDQKYAERKEKTKKYNQYKKLVEEELVPKETGREARIDKKKAERERRRDDGSPERDERDIYGGGDDFKARLAARKRAMEAKKVERAETLEKARANYEAKEDDKMQAFRDLVASGQFTKL